MESSSSTQLNSSLHTALQFQACRGGNNCKVTAMESSSCAEPNFQVEDLLDFPGEFDEDELLVSPLLLPHAGEMSPIFNAPPPLHDTASSAGNISHVKIETSVEEPSYGLCVPPDELVHQLEWLSSFHEDNSFSLGGDTKFLSLAASSSRATSSGLARCIKESPMTARKLKECFNSQSPVSVLEQSTISYTRPHGIKHAYKSHRVRKARTGGRVWSLDILKPIRVDSRIRDSYQSTSLLVTSCSSVYSEPLCSFLQQDVTERPSKKIRQMGADGDSGLVRRCTHCLVQKTPQWRAGPQGPKTLCNACGVRYKSGRLVPEYRPAASPSFVNEVHSNSHRRILEMRRVKEVELCVGIGEEANESECEGASYASYESYEEGMGMHAREELCLSKGGSLFRNVLPSKVSEDGSSCAEIAARGKEAPAKSDSCGEGTSNDSETDTSTCDEEVN